MRVLAIDPAITALGWAVLETNTVGCSTTLHGDLHYGSPVRVDSGTFCPSTAKGQPDRFDQLALFVADLVRRHTAVADAVVIETPDGYQLRSFAQLASYCRAVGICEAASFLAGRPVHRVRVSEWKGHTRKAYTQRIVASQFPGYAAADHNESDALGLALWWLGTAGYRERAAKAAAEVPKQRNLPFAGKK